MTLKPHRRLSLGLAILSCCGSISSAQQPQYPQTSAPTPTQRYAAPNQPNANQPPPQTYPHAGQAYGQPAQQRPQYPQAARQPAPYSSPQPAAPPPAANAFPPQRDYRMAQQPVTPAATGQSAVNTPAQPEHPLMPSLHWSEGAVRQLEAIGDYSATFIKRERIDGQLGEHQYIFMKVRHRPFSVYLYFMKPADLKGREAIYVEGRNGGNLLAHTTGIKDTLVGTLSLKPDSAMAMEGNRHPITDIGLLNLTRKIQAAGQRGLKFNECDVKYFPGAKIDGRLCTCMQFVYPVKRPEYTNHITRLFVDQELNLPIRYEGYDWPAEKGGQPPLVEEYTYLNLKFNNGFTDLDFDTKNPSYKFR